MAAEFINFKDLEKEAKKREKERKKAERKLKRKIFMMWCMKNPEVAIVLVSIATGVITVFVKGGINVTKAMVRTHNLNKEKKLKDLYVYDTSLGHYWELKRKLTNNEWVSIEQRRKEGERLADILYDLNVLSM